MALVIVLAFLVLMAGLVVTFLSHTGTNRQIAHGSFSNSRADQLARSALDIVVADFRQEIANGSTDSTVDNYTIYTPSSNANVLPVRSGNPSGSPDPIPNLVRRSVRSDPISPPGVGSRASTVNSTTDISLNNRSISLPRWNKHYLIPRSTASPTPVPTDTTPDSSFAAPDWVIVTRNGPAAFPGWDSGLADATSTNTTYSVGRYAYAIYDEGGLIDLNVAGYPTPTSTPATYVQTIGRKGSVGFADLTQLANMSTGGIGDVIGWRNYASVRPGGSFTNFSFDSSAASRYLTAVLSNTTGFMTVSGTLWNGGTDQAFVNRQSLIQLRGSINFTANALQYLGTFSRELNRPTWKPSTPTSINPDLASVRATSGFNRFDGTTAKVGESLLKTRFPLTRLSWLTYKGPSAAVYAANSNDPVITQLLNAGVPPSTIQAGTASNIKACFGLVWDSRAYVASPRAGQQWVYDSPSSAQSGGNFDGSNGSAATVIKTFATVQSEAREPDFFEILKAVILNGSVGLGSSGNTFITADGKYYDATNGKSADYQLIQIGANIMDSWDTDDVPSFIGFGSDPTSSPVNQPYVLAGIENIPYLNKLVFCPSFPKSPPDYFNAWLVPSLWNPHQNAAKATGTIRVALTGSGSCTAWATEGSITTTSPPMILPQSMDLNANGFDAPTPPKDSATAPLATNPATGFALGPPEKYYGFIYPFTSTTPFATQIDQKADAAFPDFGAGGTTSIELDIQLPGTSTFIPYEMWKIAATGHQLTCQGVKTNGDFAQTNKLQDPEYVALDPRTLRFGVWGTDGNSQGTGAAKKDLNAGAEDSLDQGPSANRIEQITWSKPQGASFTVSALPADLSLYATNGTASSHYIDLDGVQRRGDWTTDTNGTNSKKTIMYASSKAAPAGNYFDRPNLLSVPFQSVAELGQVFRDQPWKTLNFTIANSGDAGLLDAFTLQDVSMIAGRTSLNTRQAAVLTAILSQAAVKLNTASSSDIITSTQVGNIVTALMALTAANSMISKGEIVTRLSADASVTALKNKEARECIVRALSDACQTRTWNLMIDVIAQSGRYPPTATNLSQFVVEGEKRYWLHIAIDRFTGEIIDQQLEAVYE